jgi:hypothetical protein
VGRVAGAEHRSGHDAVEFGYGEGAGRAAGVVGLPEAAPKRRKEEPWQRT